MGFRAAGCMLLVALSVAACGTILALDETSAPSANTAPADGGNDAATTAASGIVAVDKDGKPISESTEPCVVQFLPAEGDVYATEKGGGKECTSKSPCTLASALEALASRADKLVQRHSIHVAAGSYPGVQLSFDVRIVGGWEFDGAETWKRTCKSDAVQLVSSSAEKEPATVRVESTAAELDYLTLAAREPNAGETQYGLFASSATVELHEVTIIAGSGGAGAKGDNGLETPLAVDCTVSPKPRPSAVGQAGGHAVAGDSGLIAMVAGAGENGVQGTNGAPGEQLFDETTSHCVGTASTCNTVVCKIARDPGTAGCGGSGGAGGKGGSGGGSSIGIYAYASTVNVDGGSITTGAGGTGGVGGTGRDGFLGGVGQPGKNVDGAVGCVLPATLSCGDFSPADCAKGNSDLSTKIPGGPKGTDGQAGQTGGNGGGGAGGHSVPVVSAKGATVTTSRTTPLVFGAAGNGGEANAVAGLAQERLSL